MVLGAAELEVVEDGDECLDCLRGDLVKGKAGGVDDDGAGSGVDGEPEPGLPGMEDSADEVVVGNEDGGIEDGV